MKCIKNDITPIIFIVVATCLFYCGSHIPIFKSTTIEYSIFSAYGSFISGLAAFFSIWLLIKNINSQQKQFEKQLSETKRQFEIQSFENNFFQLMSIFTQNINSLHFLNTNLKGHAVFKFLLEKFKEKTDGYLSSENTTIYKILIEKLVDEEYNNEFSVLLLQYKSILEYIDKTERNIDKQYYSKLFYAQLTVIEIALLRRIAPCNSEIAALLEKFPPVQF